MWPLNGQLQTGVEQILRQGDPSRSLERRRITDRDGLTGRIRLSEEFYERVTRVAQGRPNGHPRDEVAVITREGKRGFRDYTHTIVLADCDETGEPKEQGQTTAMQYSDGVVVGNIVFAFNRLMAIVAAEDQGKRDRPQAKMLTEEMRRLAREYDKTSFGIQGPRHWEVEHGMIAVFPKTETPDGIVGEVIELKTLARSRIKMVWGTFEQKGGQKRMTPKVEGGQEFGPNNLVEPITLEKWKRIREGIEQRRAGRYQP